ncbi:DNA-binding CsgD family transcriptional regulator [Sphingomonas sp. SORGH_AS 950]|uniref:helix-turn-helix domain-containing protein n=1 Tax=Sphingomonas sp. SORGH_AS_0950 TaxID=3041792 RepID=UPI00277F3BAF|nr:helix-turn-helix transcriptional regulator [Sphingomonas sp. SORGH_AS_0950]MDQ1158893.1 DNA-binding CsgD family transcriptional regulator [Sphingomonas sp. SORGH_AS_0950]
MDRKSAESLSPRQLECLRLVWERRISKEIARELGISKTTVDGYIAEAVQALGAKDRREAAAIVFADTPPDKVRGDPARVDQLGQSGDVEAPAIEPVAPQPQQPPAFGLGLPLSTRGQNRNDLSALATVFWIFAIAIAAMAALTLSISMGLGLNTFFRPIWHLVKSTG